MGEKKQLVRSYICEGMNRDKALSILNLSKHQYYYEQTGHRPGQQPSQTTLKLEDQQVITVSNQVVVEEYSNIVETNNYENDTDPQLNTPAIANQKVADSMAIYAQSRYNATDEVVKFNWHFGDFSGATIPGIETKEGDGITRISDLVEDFSYQANVRSSIDGRPLGSLSWWPSELATWDSDSAFKLVIHKYNNPDWEFEGPNAIAPIEFEQFIQNYPNPFKQVTEFKYTLQNPALTK